MHTDLPTLPLHRQRLIGQIEKFVFQHLSIANLTVPDIAQGLGMSERQLFRIMKSTLNTTPNKLIQCVRLEKARALLEIGEFATIAEVSHAVGFGRPDYFSMVFEKKYGMKPKSYLAKWRNNQNSAMLAE